ncbi:MAG: LytTR family DNA-binding domain-containing protein [Bacteroides sp.]|nr:LytTR family DNA-binding domain-containing protein [Bacteroides sp.]
MRILIIEDEQPASDKLLRLLDAIDPAIEVVDVLRSVEQAINWFLQHPPPELILMDIQLEDGICFEIFEACEIRTPVIFTTAYDTYTLKAFKINSVDYLLKPIIQLELKQALEKFKVFHCRYLDYIRLETVIRHLQPSVKERFLIKIGEHYKSIPTSCISCFYVRERCNFLMTDAGKHYPIDYSLEKIEQLIDSGVFFRVSRNFIVRYPAIRDIIAYSSSRLKIILENWKDQEDILVSRERVNAFKKWIDI